MPTQTVRLYQGKYIRASKKQTKQTNKHLSCLNIDSLTKTKHTDGKKKKVKKKKKKAHFLRFRANLILQFYVKYFGCLLSGSLTNAVIT